MKHKLSDRTVYILIGVFSGVAVVIIVIVILLVYCLCKYKRRRLDIDDEIQLASDSCEGFECVNWAIVESAEEDPCERESVTRDNLLQLVLEGKIKYEDEFYAIPAVNQSVKALEVTKRENEAKLRWPPEIVMMYDFNRVTLKNGKTNFIHASYINSKPHGLGRYIATQGPVGRTIADFWQMVWEQNTYSIVMLCQFTQDKWPYELSIPYWPDDRVPGSEESYGNISVKVVKVKEYADYTTRLLRIRNDDEGRSRDVTHFHYLAWENTDGQYDKVPKTPSSLLDFIRKVRRSVQSRHGPPVVHCSAGTGETGLWIATDVLTSRFHVTGNVDVYDVVYQLRQQRSNLVHFIGQYKFLYYTLVESDLCQDAEVDTNFLHALLEVVQENSDNCPVKLTLVAQFEKLQELPVVEKPAMTGRQEEHIDKNRPDTVLPFDDRLVEITSYEDPDMYINASWIDGYYRSNAYIATQDPMQQTVSDFWTMVWQQGAGAIAMLSTLGDDQDDCVIYWPQGQCPLVVGDFTITLESSRSEKEYDIRQLSVDYMMDENSKLVTLFHFRGWPLHDGPPYPSTTLIEMIMQIRKENVHNSPLVVHCRDGVSRSGVFCALYNCMDSLDDQGLVCVPSVVRNLRRDRRNMVPTVVGI